MEKAKKVKEKLSIQEYTKRREAQAKNPFRFIPYPPFILAILSIPLIIFIITIVTYIVYIKGTGE